MEVIKKFIDDGTEKRVSKVLNDLTFLSRIKKGKIVNIHPKSIEEKTIWNRIARAWSGKESRTNTLEFIKETFSRALVLLCEKLSDDESFDTTIKEVILKSIKEAKDGVRSLCASHPRDTNLKSRVETELKLLDTKLDHLLGRN